MKLKTRRGNLKPTIVRDNILAKPGNMMMKKAEESVIRFVRKESNNNVEVRKS